MVLKPKWNPINKFCVARVHYSCDEEKNTPEWLARAREGISQKSWDREYEISYETFSGKSVYEDFGEHLITPIEYKPNSYVYRGWDFGYHHPACAFVIIDENDRFCVKAEIMGENEGIKEFGMRVRRYSMAEFPGAKWLDSCDPAGHQKNDKSEFTSVEVLNSLGIYPTSRPSHIDEGLEILRQRMVRRNDGQYGFAIDPSCTVLIDGYKGGYRYPEVKEGSPDKEEPLKDGFYDHCFIAETLITTNNGQKRIDRVRVGDKVLTRYGFKKVISSWMTNPKAVVKKVIFSNGSSITGTGNHPIYVKKKGWVAIDDLRYGDIIETCETSTDLSANQSKLSLMDIDTTDIQTHQGERIGFITPEQVESATTSPYGKSILEKFRKDFISTIKMGILLTIILKTLSAFLGKYILVDTQKKDLATQKFLRKLESIVPGYEILLKNGTLLKREGSGTQNMLKKCKRVLNQLKKRAYSAEKNISPRSQLDLSSVVEIVRQNIDGLRTRILSKEFVQFAVAFFRSTSTLLQKPADQKSVFVVSSQEVGIEPVYNLTVEECPEYYANGVLVHNCQDAVRYVAINYLELAPIKGESSVKSADNSIMSGGGNSIMGSGNALGSDFGDFGL